VDGVRGGVSGRPGPASIAGPGSGATGPGSGAGGPSLGVMDAGGAPPSRALDHLGGASARDQEGEENGEGERLGVLHA
jgi:hypothetical protein